MGVIAGIADEEQVVLEPLDKRGVRCVFKIGRRDGCFGSAVRCERREGSG